MPTTEGREWLLSMLVHVGSTLDGFMRLSRAFSITAVIVVFVVSGCTSDPSEEPVVTIRQATEDLIIADVADGAGLGALTPQCPDVLEAGVGTTYSCTATTEDQRTVALTAVLDELGHVQLATTNLITAAALPSFERAAVDALNATVPSNLGYDAIDCGDATIVFATDATVERTVVCGLRDPDTSEIFDVTLSIADIEARQFSLVVAETPRA